MVNISETRNKMNEKIDWARSCWSKCNTYIPTNEREGKHYFWGYLQAFQQTRNYYGVFLEESGVKNKLPKYIDEFKKTLHPQEARVWDILNDLRNSDSHDGPVPTNYKIGEKRILVSTGLNGRQRILVSRGLNGETRILTSGGSPQYGVEYKGEFFLLDTLMSLGIHNLVKLAELFDQITLK